MDTNVRIALILLLAALTPAVHGAVADEARPCASCHACPRPTAADPCLLACPRHGVAAGPDRVVLDTLENLYEPVRFAHRVHARMASLDDDCVSCHHVSPAGTYPPCKDCHSAAVPHEPYEMPGLKGAYHRQCMGCHQEWSADTECGVCHALKADRAERGDDYVAPRYKPCKQPELRLFETAGGAGPWVTFFHRNHASLYGADCGDCHRQDPCVRCHDQGEKAPPAAGDGAVTHGRCAACHDTDELSECEICHADAARQAPFHTWPLGETHEGLDCTDCHGARGFAAVPGCADCHGESATELMARRKGF